MPPMPARTHIHQGMGAAGRWCTVAWAAWLACLACAAETVTVAEAVCPVVSLTVYAPGCTAKGQAVATDTAVDRGWSRLKGSCLVASRVWPCHQDKVTDMGPGCMACSGLYTAACVACQCQLSFDPVVPVSN